MAITQPLPVAFDIDSLDALRHSRPRAMVSLGRFQRRFGYTAQDLEGLSNMPAGSARQNPFAARLQRFMGYAMEVVALKMLDAHDLEDAIAWFRREPLERFEGRTAEELIAQGRAAAVLHELRGQPRNH